MNQERNATKDSSLSQDQVRKLQDGVKDANPFDDESEEWDDGGAYALLGPRLRTWRRRVRRVNDQVVTALEPLDWRLRYRMHADVFAVAGQKKPAGMAFFISLNKWPDRSMPIQYFRG